MAANALLDRGWGKAAQFVDVQGEIKQLVAVQLNVVRVDEPKEIGPVHTNLLTNPEKPNDINGADLCAKQVDAPPGETPE
jgi:hypothetical protein